LGRTWSLSANIGALGAGVASEKIVFSGVGKTAAEMAMALEGGLASST
jgi:diaminopimelate decarboxylase